MTTIGFVCEYNGANFHGFQRQIKNPSIQAELEVALTKYFRQSVRVVGSGRTDAGVHARGQVCSFTVSGELVNQNLFQLAVAINAMLPSEICVRDFFVAQSFNARYSATAKTYSYRCYVSPHRSPLRTQMFQLYKMPDVTAMQLAAEQLIGTHDFSSFTTVKNSKEDKVRTIYSIQVLTLQQDEILFRVRGSGFLKNMVRIMVGTLLAVGSGKIQPGDIKRILDARDRVCAGETAPAHGLCLESVDYS